MSRGRLNIATCLVTGSIETTISVSVLWVESPGRWSLPISRMLRRSLPFQGGIATVGRADPAGVASGSGLSVGSTEPATVGVGDPFGEGDASAEQSVELDVSPMKMQSLSRTSSASMS